MRLIVQKNHIALCFSELSAVALVGSAREAIAFGADQPAEHMLVHATAIGAVQPGWLGRLSFNIERPLIHDF